MAAGQAMLRSNVLDVGAVDAVEGRLAEREAARHAAHADALRDALELARLYEAAGMDVCVPAQLALVWRCSETRATTLLLAASLLTELPGALELLDAAVLTVEQSAQVARGLQVLEPAVRDAVWARVAAELQADAEQGVQRPPARLAEQVRRWAVEVHPASAVERRRRAESDGDVLFQRRDDGLFDVLLKGLTAPDAEGCLGRISAAAAPFGSDDDRPAGKRRLDAAVDLLLGRTGRPARQCTDGAGGSCGCPLGGSVPCGADVTVLVPLATALGAGDVPAELVGHGPLEPDLLAALLGSAPVLRAVWVGPDGAPVSMPDQVEHPDRNDAKGVRQALRRLVAAPPGQRHPRHGDDHDLPPDDDNGGPPGRAGPPDDETGGTPPEPDSRGRPGRHRPRLHTRPHPADTAGAYRIPARLQRFLAVRAPRCEWPGCGARASRCDLDHDVAWPHGPTCACNCGPLCRRHHRIKQAGWVKHRTADGVRWTGPTGRQTLSPGQHPPVPRVRPAAAHEPTPLDELSPLAHEQERWTIDPTAPMFDGLSSTDPGPAGWQRQDDARQERRWAAELATLRRQVHRTSH
jgi:hypothetical protein